ncbi:MAG: hypothetical protein J5I94_07595 [Phaeodactylibacter sp.]|nr:hypothetical protein [Phaeodactylibacter sp.]
MKTFRIALAALALLAISLPVRANVNPFDLIKFCTKQVEAKKVVVELANLAQQPTSILLKSTFGEVYYKDHIRKHNGHRALLDLEQLPEGRYILSVIQKGETKSQIIKITKDRLLVSQCAE